MGQGEQKTVTVQQLSELYRQGTIHPNTFVWREGMASWQPISEVTELRGVLPENEPEEVSALESSSGAREIDDMPTTMLQSPMMASLAPAAPLAPPPQVAPIPAPAPSAP
ncbi:MAG: DUF4339 domain-containing protein, partial [Polyangiaceae bacterium]|nr:DUF4339 domain-containing protein [Polyangiaceae bacterium]